MTITYHAAMIQGSDEWLAARCGLLTAGSLGLILTPTLKVAANEKERAHLFELLAQRITQYVEPRYVGDDMLRGLNDEVMARALYSEKFAPVNECGLITNDELGFTVGCSPDGLVAKDGGIECKSRRQKFQVETIIGRVMPAEYALQVQGNIWISGRKWWDFVSYCGGMPMAIIRVHPDHRVIEAIKEACSAFESRLQDRWGDYRASMASEMRLVPTERVVEQEMFI